MASGVVLNAHSADGFGRSLLRVAVIGAAALVVFPHAVSAQDGAESLRSWSVEQRFQGSSSSFGQIVKSGTTFSYSFDDHVTLSAGVPFYLVNYADGEGTDGAFKSGIGNVYGSLHLNLNGEWINYTSSVTVTAPTGDRQKGLGTGQPTVDWNNGFYRVFGRRVAPYANIGIASTISDTPFFLRPFSSEGFVAHLEGGATLSLSPLAYVGASAYRFIPSGEQTIVSRVVETRTEPAGPAERPGNSQGRGAGRNRSAPDRVFETITEVVGTADLASDHGFSTWVGIGPWRNLDFTLGYSRSERYALNTLFWGVGIQILSSRSGVQ